MSIILFEISIIGYGGFWGFSNRCLLAKPQLTTSKWLLNDERAFDAGTYQPASLAMICVNYKLCRKVFKAPLSSFWYRSERILMSWFCVFFLTKNGGRFHTQTQRPQKLEIDMKTKKPNQQRDNNNEKFNMNVWP